MKGVVDGSQFKPAPLLLEFLNRCSPAYEVALGGVPPRLSAPGDAGYARAKRARVSLGRRRHRNALWI